MTDWIRLFMPTARELSDQAIAWALVMLVAVVFALGWYLVDRFAGYLMTAPDVDRDEMDDTLELTSTREPRPFSAPAAKGFDRRRLDAVVRAGDSRGGGR